jgi:pimeloyl-ACP methyl ester carboxylesterase
MKRHYVEVAPGVELYVEETGQGRPLVFTPGWTMTTEVFARQVPHFAERYRVVTYDPRGQGRSTKTLQGNSYPQHGADLGRLLDALDLRDAVLLPWSYGCLEAWQLLRDRGPGCAAGVVFIDEPPRPFQTDPEIWGEGDGQYMVDFQRALSDRHREATREFCAGMWQGTPPADELDWVADQSMMTPLYVTQILAIDGASRDYTAEAEAIDGKLPVMHIVCETNGDVARRWLKTHSPHARCEALGEHFMFWEFAERFNALVDDFLATNKL